MSASQMRMSLALKAALFVGLLALVSSTVLVTLNILAERDLHRRDLLERADGLVLSTAGLAQNATAAVNITYLERLLGEIARQPMVMAVSVISKDGFRLADGDPQTSVGMEKVNSRPALAAMERGSVVRRIDGDFAQLAAPILRNGDIVGAVTLDVSLQSVNERALAIFFRNAWLVIIALVVITPLSGLVIRKAMLPVRQLTRASERVAARDFNLSIDVRTGDELEVLACAFNDMVGQLQTSLTRIRFLAFMDELTKLPNKTAFLEHARREVSAAKTPGAVLLINLDRFKRLNDTFGVHEGDRILTLAADRLRAVAERLKARYQHEEARQPVIARLAGDEFAILICGPAPTGAAKATARDLIDALSTPMTIMEQQVSITASVGIARFPHDAADAEHLLRHANLALDRAKADGGGCFHFFEPEMTRRAVERVTIENELRQAIANKEFVVHYQPKVDARSGGIVGCEALVRWNHKGKLIYPGHFIDVAEESGLIGAIGDFVLLEACEAAARWRDAGFPLHVAVNVSAAQFDSESFNRQVLKTLKTAGLEPELLELELTESVAMNDPERVIAQVEPLRALGVRFAIDDFGTGYSSLSSLTRLPFDVFKIDQSFVRGMDNDQNARVVIETILAMARSLGYATVAEGVETEPHYAFLRLNGCSLIQGYLFGKPAPEEEFLQMVRDDRRPIADQSAVSKGTPLPRRA